MPFFGQEVSKEEESKEKDLNGWSDPSHPQCLMNAEQAGSDWNFFRWEFVSRLKIARLFVEFHLFNYRVNFHIFGLSQPQCTYYGCAREKDEIWTYFD